MTKTKEKPILLDVDGCCALFEQHCLDYAKNLGVEVPDISLIKEDVRKYDWYKKVNLEEHVMSKGFCENLPVSPGAQDFVENVKAQGHRVIFLTSAYNDHQYWHWERYQWLKKHFNIVREDLIFATDKRFVDGLVLIDDKPKNVIKWQNHQNKRGIIFAQPWNESFVDECDIVARYVPYTLEHKRDLYLIDRTNDWDLIETLLSPY